MKYEGVPSLCADVLKAKGAVSTDKYSLKALATMNPGFEMHQDSMTHGNTCVIPNEVVGALGISKYGDSCMVVTKNVSNDQNDKTHFLTVSKDAVLPLDANEHAQYLEEGKGIFPVDGCIVKADDTVKVNDFTQDLGSVIDFDNAKILYRLNVELAALKAECQRLQNEIDHETGVRNSRRNTLAHWQYWCGVYLNNRQWYRDQNRSLSDQIANRRRYLEEQARRAAEAAAAAAAAAAAWGGGGGGSSAERRHRKKSNKCKFGVGRLCFSRR